LPRALAGEGLHQRRRFVCVRRPFPRYLALDDLEKRSAVLTSPKFYLVGGARNR